MPHYVGLDVSQKTTTICVVDEQGRPMPHSRRPYSARGSWGRVEPGRSLAIA
jgi:hypothetical protein